MPKISVIIPTYNRLETLPRAVNSVLDQTERDFDLWIVDDGSTDQTESWVQNELLSADMDISIHYLRSNQKGVSHARNLAIQASSGEWLAFLDSDDEWLPQKLSSQMELVQQNPDLCLVHGEEIWIRNGVRVNPMKKHQKSGGRIFDRSVKLCCVSPSTALIKRETFAACGGTFREDFPVCEDYELWLRISALFEVGFVTAPIIKKYGGHEDQLSQKFKAMDYYRVKALEPFLESDSISEEERNLVLETVRKKCQILLRGFERHKNFERYEEVLAISKKCDFNFASCN